VQHPLIQFFCWFLTLWEISTFFYFLQQTFSNLPANNHKAGVPTFQLVHANLRNIVDEGKSTFGADVIFYLEVVVLAAKKSSRFAFTRKTVK